MGSGIKLYCSSCGFSMEYTEGRGMNSCYTHADEKLIKRIEAGELGDDFLLAYKNASNPRVGYTFELFQCEKCGQLGNRAQYKIYDGSRWPIFSQRFECKNCHGNMVVVTDQRVFCPKCGQALHRELTLLWD